MAYDFMFRRPEVDLPISTESFLRTLEALVRVGRSLVKFPKERGGLRSSFQVRLKALNG